MRKPSEKLKLKITELEKRLAENKREQDIEASLEKVRSKAMAMHNSQDLADTIGVFYKELHSFSLTPIRCGVGLLNKKDRSAELFTWNTTEQGSSLQLIGILKMEGHPVLEKVYEGWIMQTEYHPVLRGNEIIQYYKVLRPQIDFPNLGHEVVQYGHFFFFHEGGVYAWTENEMREDELNIYRRFTSVLSLTYKRYLDLQRAEAQAIRAKQDLTEIKKARKKAVDTLAALKAAQAQLIQSEKMASLGELTAGIAHEIQNPLNFVNNFSEMNAELIEELQQEARAGNTEGVLQLADSIKDNEQKIVYHGRRAESIVKGMLLHSRAGSGKKEPTNINALLEECLRLSYHGLRTKNKDFTARLIIDLDESIGKINIIPQDISRVLLNLFNNAFYAVNEKKHQLNGTFEPGVSVCTKKMGNKVRIAVQDNGYGIPENILGKIFQPFFTTKPTGQGTGLGLSMSYDVIRAHGGVIKVETKEGEGSLFTAEIPF